MVMYQHNQLTSVWPSFSLHEMSKITLKLFAVAVLAYSVSAKTKAALTQVGAIVHQKLRIDSSDDKQGGISLTNESVDVPVMSPGQEIAAEEDIHALSHTETSLADRWHDALIITETSVSFYTSLVILQFLYFVQAFLGPVLSSIVRIFYRLLIQPIISYIQSSLPQMLPPDQNNQISNSFAENGRRDQDQKNGNDAESFTGVQEKHIIKTAKEDQKSLKGDRRDVERLRRFGYQKYRFVSQGFLQRNGLLIENDSKGANIDQVSVKDDSSVKRVKRKVSDLF